MYKKVFFVLLILFLFSLNGCIQEPNEPESSLDEIVIGDQIWTAYNYNLNYFNSETSFGVAYNNDPNQAEIYGMLLTYQDALAGCPDGWHLPSMEEWQILFDHLGGNEIAGGKLKSSNHWTQPNIGEINASGFNALPAGGASNHLQFDGLGWSAHYWSTTPDGNLQKVPSFFSDSAAVDVISIPKNMYASARYIKD